jgi:FMN phosphatase YigB (HAD superfamily)
MRTLSIYILIFTGLIIPGVYAMEKNAEPKKTIAISFDLDGVFTLTFKPKTGSHIPTWIERISGISPLVQNAHARNPSLTEKLKDQLNNEGSCAVYPVTPIIDLIHILKANGYPVVAATNQEIATNRQRTKELRDQHGLHSQNLFEHTLVTQSIEEKCPDELTLDNASSLHNHVEDTMHVVSYVGVGKPLKHYYLALQSLVKSKHPHITEIIHIDDFKMNIDGVDKIANMHGIHFDVDIKKAELNAIEAAVADVKTALIKHGVNCD